MLSRSFFPNFGQGPFPKIAGKSPVIDEVSTKVSYAVTYVFHFLLSCIYPGEVVSYPGKSSQIPTLLQPPGENISKSATPTE